MTVQLKKRLVSVADYHKMAEIGILPERGVELINGEIIEMSPIGSKHAKIVNKLNQILNVSLGQSVIISVQNPIIANDFSEPEPDITVLKRREDFYENEHPHGKDALLVIEVSDSSVAYDRKFKLPLYAESGVPECWLIDVEKQEIYTHWQPAGQAYKFSELVQRGELAKTRYFELELDTAQLFR
ncbi:MAG TPA: Uma2 family endonuclease [Saprospiraceae bacterium]|nr:Uma2 family endonuclease [Saprospiraceae bacterium]HMP25156.1 Uma2 family endonuclease [Saprospiraceae bacterium]